MMQAMREGVGRWVAILLMALIGFGFIFFGIDFTTTTATVAARVNGDQIAMLEFERVLQRQLTEYQQLYRIELNDDLRREIRANVLENMVREQVLMQHVDAAGYRASDARVAQAILSDQNFQVGDEFDDGIYRSALANVGLLPEQYEEQQRAQLAYNDLQRGVVNSTFLTPAEFRLYVELTGQRREIAYAAFEVENFSEAIEVSEEEISEHYEANGAFYMSPESVDFEYVEVSLADIAANTIVSEEDLRAYYDSERGLFETEEERHVRHILITEDDEAVANSRAEEVLARIEGGETFEALAEELSDDPGTRAQGGDLGRIVRGMLPGAFEDAVFDMAEGEVRGPVRSDFGVHVIRVDAIDAGDTQEFENVRDDLLSQLRTQRAEDQFYEMANALGDRAYYADGDLAEIAAELMLPLVTVNNFARTGDAGMFENSAAIVQAAFSDEVLRERRNSDLVELSEGDVVVLRVIEHNLPEQQTLEEIRDIIVEEIRSARAAELAAEAAAAFRADAPQAEDLAALAEESGGTWEQRRWILRNDAAVPQQVVARVFGMSRPTQEPLWDTVVLASGGESVVVLYDVAAGAAESIPREERDAQQVQLGQQAGIAELTAYAEAIRADADVVVTPEALDPIYY